jgi:hypothetical protein
MIVRALAAVLSLSTGCSFLLVRPPPAPPIVREVECVSSPMPPITDLTLGLLGIGSGIAGLSASRPDCNSGGGQDFNLCLDFSAQAHVAGAVLAVIGALFTGSAIYGFSQTSACGAMVDTQRACRDGSSEACARLVAVPAAAEPGQDPHDP